MQSLPRAVPRKVSKKVSKRVNRGISKAEIKIRQSQTSRNRVNKNQASKISLTVKATVRAAIRRSKMAISKAASKAAISKAARASRNCPPKNSSNAKTKRPGKPKKRASGARIPASTSNRNAAPPSRAAAHA